MKPIIILFFLFPLITFGQNADSLKNTPKNHFFANIYTNVYGQKSTDGLRSGFYLHTGLFGYSNQLNSKVKGTIIFDVTRTTNNFKITDSNNILLNVNYFEGSKYTAYLKMAAIEWQFIPNFNFSIGQLLNTQYLTFIDKFWEHRFVEVSFQELNRFGNPADFGAQLSYQKPKKLLLELGVFNGEGPFRYQDDNSNFLISGNIQYNPIEKITLKVYFAQHFAKIDSLKNKNIISIFAGYKSQKFTLSAEYDYVKSVDFFNSNWSGLSVFAFYNLTNKWQLFYRYDYIVHSQLYNYKALHIMGIEFKPADNFFVSTNYRYFSQNNTNSIFLNFGIKF